MATIGVATVDLVDTSLRLVSSTAVAPSRSSKLGHGWGTNNSPSSWPKHHINQPLRSTPLLRVGLHVVSSGCQTTGSTRIYRLDQPCSLDEGRVFTEASATPQLIPASSLGVGVAKVGTTHQGCVVSNSLIHPMYSGFVLSPISGPQVYMPESPGTAVYQQQAPKPAVI